MSFFTILIVAVIAILFYRFLTKPSERDVEMGEENERMKQAAVASNAKKELLFYQFGGYVNNVLDTNGDISWKDFINLLQKDFPNYGNGKGKLWSELLDAEIIGGGTHVEKGDLFRNIDLVYPNFVACLRYITTETKKGYRWKIQPSGTGDREEVVKTYHKGGLFYSNFGIEAMKDKTQVFGKLASFERRLHFQEITLEADLSLQMYKQLFHEYEEKCESTLLKHGIEL